MHAVLEWVRGWVNRKAAHRKPPPLMTLVLDDIVQQDVDVLVNAADQTMMGGTGVDGATHAAAGPELARACRTLGRCPVGAARMTPGFKLKARHVLHAVAPVWDSSGSAGVDRANKQMLAACFEDCLLQADRIGARSIAFPSLGAGAFGWSVEDVAEAAVGALRRTCRGLRSIEEVRFVAFGPNALQVWERALNIRGVIVAEPGTLRYHPGRAAEF